MRLFPKGPQINLRAFFFALLLPTVVWAEPLIGIAFPPVATAQQQDFTITALDDLGVRHIRIAESWTRRPLVPSAADFAPLRQRLDRLHAAGLQVMLTVQADAPPSACGHRGKSGCLPSASAPFETYITNLLAAVGDRIEAIQFGNEWDEDFAGDSAAYLATHARFAAMVRAKAPDLPLVLGGITGRAPYAQAYCQTGIDPALPVANDRLDDLTHSFCTTQKPRNQQAQRDVAYVLAQADYDVADIHLYDVAGLWPAAVDWIAAQTGGRPVWASEWGGPMPRIEPQTPSYHAERLASYIAVLPTLPLARAYYFKLTDDPASYHSRSGLFTLDAKPKPALAVFRAAFR